MLNDRLILGNVYDEKFTIFRVFATNVQKIYVRVYRDFSSYRSVDYQMLKTSEENIYEVKIDGNLNGVYYNYVIERIASTYVTTDPYALSSSSNSRRSVVLDERDLYPDDFEEDDFVDISPNEAIIYETHIRDATMHKSADIRNRGKYIGVAEHKNRNDFGIGYVKSVGFTHIHYLPIQDFYSIDEDRNDEYNWGYDPESYFVPEGSYSTNPNNPKARVLELKEMIKAHHDIGLGVIMDVVFNHTYRVEGHPFWVLAPEVYYRYNSDGTLSNGSGVGNELNTEHKMVRHLIIESLCYFARCYHIDGFRFDLMALIDRDTMRAIQKRLKKINPKVILYGEPWTGSESSLSYDKQMNKSREKDIKVGLFNDDFRNALKGDNDGTSRGLLQGDITKLHDVLTGVVGSISFSNSHIGFAREPYESINYISSHDNLTFYDKLRKSTNFNYDGLEKITRVGLAIIMFSFGIPFMQAGSELLRSKQMNHNSYNAADIVNSIDWSQVYKKYKMIDFLEDVISIRKKYKMFSAYSTKDIVDTTEFINCSGVISYRIKAKNKRYKTLQIIINPQNIEIDYQINIPKNSKLVFKNKLLDDAILSSDEVDEIKLKEYDILVYEI